MTKATVTAYVSPGCVFLAFDWQDGKDHADFLGFAIERTPGYSSGGKPEFLFNKLDFVPITANSKPKPSDQAPIQKFNWWDGGINPADQGKKFTYRVVPVLGTGGSELKLQNNVAGLIDVTVPANLDGKIATWFNRAVVSSQSFLKVAKGPLDKQMEWLANGIQNAVPTVLSASGTFDCAIYHLTDKLWVLPAIRGFKGRGAITYFDKPSDTASEAAISILNDQADGISTHKRDKTSGLMHDKFIVSNVGGKPDAVLMGSTNFTPEAQTIQANLLHILHSPQLAELYSQRAELLAANEPTKDVATKTGWHEISDLPGSKVRVNFLPEPGKQRDFLDTVVAAVEAAKSSVLFCMFTASDQALMDAIFAKGDSKDHLIYGVINAIDDPSAPTKSGKPRKMPAIAATIYHRSQADTDTLPYAAFDKKPPAGFLPELRAIDTSKYDANARGGKKKSGPPTIHIHHKFIVIDGDTDSPTIYSGSPNFSASSENKNDENVLEISGDTTLARVYVAEFMRLYNHYRARAIWDREHSVGGAKVGGKSDTNVLVLADTRDGWAKEAYTQGTKASLARSRRL